MELMDYLRIARKHWRSIVAVVLLTVLGAGLYSMLSKPTYTATTSIFVTIGAVATTANDFTWFSAYVEPEFRSPAVLTLATDTKIEVVAVYVGLLSIEYKPAPRTVSRTTATMLRQCLRAMRR